MTAKYWVNMTSEDMPRKRHPASQRADEYVLGLPSWVVTTSERFILKIIAQNYRDRFSAACFELGLLCEETGLSSRQVRRLLAGLVDRCLLEYVPGRGEGHFGQFRFPNFQTELRVLEKPLEAQEEDKKGDRKGTRRGHFCHPHKEST